MTPEAKTVHAHTPGAAVRNGLPATRRYTWRARRPTWMTRAITEAQLQYGPPVPTCFCGTPLDWQASYGTCPKCGWRSTSPAP